MTPSQVVEHAKRKDHDPLTEPGVIGRDAGPSLLPLLDDRDAQVRELTVYYLDAAGGPAARQGMLKALHDRTDTVRAVAARFLQKHYTPEDLPAIEEDLAHSPDEYVREQLSLLLGKTGDRSKIPLLQRSVVTEKDEHAQHAMSLALARLGDPARRHELIGRLEQDDPAGRVKALRDLPYVNDRSLLVNLMPLLDDLRPGLNVGPSHGPYFIRVCDVAVNVANEILGGPFPWVQPVKRYSPQELAQAKMAIAAVH